MHFCGVAEQLATKDLPAEAARMPTNRPTWCLQAEIRPFTDAQARQYLADAFARWSKVCNVVFSETSSPGNANFVITEHDFGDGPSGVLADCQLPYGGQQRMRLDRQGRWVVSTNPPSGSVDLIAVAAHEMGHGIGLSHLPTGGLVDLMEPFYRPGLRDPQAAETAMVVQLYGEPKVSQPPTTPVTPLGDSLGVELFIRAAGQEWVAKGEAKKR